MSALRMIDEMVNTSLIWDKSIQRIGMDGKGVSKRKQVFNITNLIDNEVIGVLPNLSQKELLKELLKIDLKFRLELKKYVLIWTLFFQLLLKNVFLMRLL